ncbi:inorganic pyrophosphatase [Fennellomyces sp. T-0311]|nr:inorganic pyrophosphatase [Fennellomyces sp. T-0311]
MLAPFVFYKNLMKASFLAILLAVAGSTAYNVRQIGALNTEDYRVYLENDNGIPISPFHDVPLHPDPKNITVFNMIVEIPKGKNAKLEIDKETPFNPIYHDSNKKGLRYIADIPPHKGYPGNYGSIPQTWENPHAPNKEIGTSGGDNDPVDIFEIGDASGYPGQVKQVKLLGGLLMIDDDLTDWKLFAIDINDKRALRYNDITDVEDDILKVFQHWYKVYKVPQGKGENKFAFGGKFQNRKYVEQLMVETHDYWQLLINGTTDSDIETVNLSNQGTPNQVGPDSRQAKKVPKAHPLPDAPVKH